MKTFTLKLHFIISFFFAALSSFSQTDVLMQHNDLNRTGWNPNETILNTSNVTPTNFGLLYKHTVDDQIYAQPLIISGVNVTDPVSHTLVTRNLLIVVTVKNTMYAFDADDGSLAPYWQKNFTPAGEIPPMAVDVHAALCNFTYSDFKISANGLGQAGAYGTVGTPAIDKSTNTLYFVSRYRDQNVDNTAKNSTDHVTDPDWSSAGFFQQVHALDLSTGAEKFNGPVIIDPATTFVMGTGVDHDAGNKIHFDPRRQNQRGGLFISNGIVYIPYAGHCDMDNYHGWILGYKLNDLTQQLVRYTSTPNDERGGIWMSGAAPAVDATGNIYFAVGNGNNASISTSPQNMALSVVKTAPDLVNNTLSNVSWYKASPATYNAWNTSDLDFATGVVLIPGTNMLVTAHKSGKIMTMPMGIPAPGGAFDDTNPDFHSYSLGAGANAQSHSSLTYFGGAANKYIYQFSENTHLMAFPVNTTLGTLGTAIQNTSVPVNTIMEGGYSSVSSNGTDPLSAILWVTNLTGTTGGTVHALKADDITQELWNSDQNADDQLGNYAKMSPPTIANGKVYVSTFTNTLNVYGLLASNNRCVTNIALNKTYGDLPTPNTILPAANAFDNDIVTRWAIGGPVPQYLYVDLGARFDICKTSIRWNKGSGGFFTDYAVDFTVDISEDGTTWTTLNTVTGNSFTTDPAINEFNEHATGRYVRVNITRGGQGGSSISEFQVLGSPANNCVSPNLSDMTVTNITENSATLGWKPVPGITNYIVRYRPSFVSSYVTRNVQDLSGSGNPLHVDVVGLTCGFSYDFNIESDCGSGQISNPSVLTFNTSACNSPCLNLTRWYSADLGDVQVAGKTCYTAVTEQEKTWTITGAGNGIGSNGDVFQINFSDQSVDGEFIASIESQDALPASNQAGIMMRDSVTDISRFIFIGKTGDNQLVLIYRSTPGSMATTMFAPNTTNAKYFRLLKAGTTYTAFYGSSTAGPWTPFGPAGINLNFGTQTINVGMGVSSTNATTVSTALFKITDNTIPLPIELLNFSATNVTNNYVKLDWQTSMEVNNDHFEVERSTNASDFKTILSMKSLGNSSTTQSYTARDDEPIRGINYYRLKQVDSDGRKTYSATQKVKFGVDVAPLIYPNPVSDLFTAVSGKELIREIVIYNAQGRAVQFVIGNSTDEDLKVNVSLLSKGVYFLKVKTDSQNYQFKMIKK